MTRPVGYRKMENDYPTRKQIDDNPFIVKKI